MNEYILLFRLDKMISLTLKIEKILSKDELNLILEGAIEKFRGFMVDLFVDNGNRA